MGIAGKIRHSLNNASLIRRVADEGLQMRRDGRGDVLDLSLGNPSLDPPPAFHRAIQDLLVDPPPGAHRYMQNNGYPETRQAVADSLSERYDLPFTYRHITMQVGAAGGINVFLKSILDPGDEVIFFNPYFVEYGFYVDNHGGVPVIVPTGDDFQIDLNALAEAITPKTRAVLINSPNNPTGVVYTPERMQAMCELLDKASEEHGHAIYLINDTPYRRLLYNQDVNPEPFLWYKHGVMITSLSKDLGIPGERVGIVALSPHCPDVDDLLAAMAFSSRVLGFVNAPALMQRVLPRLLDATVDLELYRDKRDRIYEALTLYGYEMVKPEGAFYFFPKAPGGDDVAFYEAMKRRRVLVVPGSGFGAPDYFRIAYCVSDEVLERALPLFGEVYRVLTA
jgi:aspartate aminotransferase